MALMIDSEQQYLSPKEARVLYELAMGKTKKQIARLLFREPSTIKTHIDHLAEKLGSRNVANMVYIACEKGFFKFLPCLLIAILSIQGITANLARRVPRPIQVARVQMRRPVERLGSELS